MLHSGPSTTAIHHLYSVFRRGPLFMLSLLVFISCQETPFHESRGKVNSQDLEVITLDEALDAVQKVTWDSVYSVVQMIEIHDTVLFSEVSKLINIADSLLLVVDKKNEQLLIFDIVGKAYIRTIKRLGRGPEEYSSLENVIYNLDLACIEVLDLRARKLLRYDLEGKCISEIKLKEHVESLVGSMEYLDKGNYLFSRQNRKTPDFPGQAILYNIEEERMLLHGIAIPPSLSDRSMTGFGLSVHPYQGHLWAMYPLNDTVYEISSESISTRYVFDYTRRNRVLEEAKSATHAYHEDDFDALLNYRTQPGIGPFRNLYKTDAQLIVSFLDHNLPLTLFYHLDLKKPQVYHIYPMHQYADGVEINMSAGLSTHKFGDNRWVTFAEERVLPDRDVPRQFLVIYEVRESLL
jgi:hypothetical protein